MLLLAAGFTVAFHASAQAADDQMAEMEQTISAREISQTIAIADECEIHLDPDKVADIAEKIAGWSATARMFFQSSGRAQKFRMKEYSAAEKAAACGIARATARKYNLVDG